MLPIRSSGHFLELIDMIDKFTVGCMVSQQVEVFDMVETSVLSEQVCIEEMI